MPNENKQPAQRGRPSEGLSEMLALMVTPELKHWLALLVQRSGIREGALVRRILEGARARNWTPR